MRYLSFVLVTFGTSPDAEAEMLLLPLSGSFVRFTFAECHAGCFYSE